MARDATPEGFSARKQLVEPPFPFGRRSPILGIPLVTADRQLAACDLELRVA
jgi:hypothetical protein